MTDVAYTDSILEHAAEIKRDAQLFAEHATPRETRILQHAMVIEQHARRISKLLASLPSCVEEFCECAHCEAYGESLALLREVTK